LGIPSRVVNGFRGGEYNDLTGSYIVRARDAHSWVEAYFPEYGWITFDPTPAASTPAASRWSRLGLYVDAAREIWREWIINYDFSHQIRLSAELSSRTYSAQSSFRFWLLKKYNHILGQGRRLQNRFGKISTKDVGLFCIPVFLLVLLLFLPRTWQAWQRMRIVRHPATAPGSAASLWYLRMLKVMAGKGFRKSPSQTPAEFTASIADPEAQKNVAVFTAHYQRARYADSAPDAEKLPELYAALTGKK
jgi:protein-glutamine gamma-glutamyltransferase